MLTYSLAQYSTVWFTKDQWSGQMPLSIADLVYDKWTVFFLWILRITMKHYTYKNRRITHTAYSLMYLYTKSNHIITLCPQKSEPPKHFATATANLHWFKWNFTQTRRHLFLSSTSNFIRIPYSVYEMFNSFKLLSQISVTDTTYFLLTSSVWCDVSACW